MPAEVKACTQFFRMPTYSFHCPPDTQSLHKYQCRKQAIPSTTSVGPFKRVNCKNEIDEHHDTFHKVLNAADEASNHQELAGMDVILFVQYEPCACLMPNVSIIFRLQINIKYYQGEKLCKLSPAVILFDRYSDYKKCHSIYRKMFHYKK